MSTSRDTIDWGKPVGDGRPLADSEVVPRLRDIQKQIGGSYAIDRAIEVLEQLSSAQPEIIRCKDCKHYRTTGAFGIPLRKEDYWCNAENFPDEGQKELPEWWFCAGGEPKGEDV